MIREPRDFAPNLQQLPNGKQFTITDALDLARTQYLGTRQTYNLLRQQRVKTYEKRKKSRGRYTKEDYIFVLSHSLEEIAKKFNMSKQQAYATKYYLIKMWGN